MIEDKTKPEHRIAFKTGSQDELTKGIICSVWLYSSAAAEELAGYIRHSTGSDPLQDHLFWYQRSDALDSLFGPSYPDLDSALKKVRKLILNPTKNQMVDEQRRRTGKFLDAWHP